MEYRTGKEQTRPFGHVNHCMDALRRQIMCDADSTPRVTDDVPDAISGVGQYRKCRDWSKLEDWAKQNTACYKRPEVPHEGDDISLRFSHCPEGSGYIVGVDRNAAANVAASVTDGQ